MKSDIEIAQDALLVDIKNILGKDNAYMIESYGKGMGKISYTYIDNKKVHNCNLILVTAITPTKAGIGKTTVSIGLNDALRKIDKNSMAVLREPSLGPCFGMKGGACGGGYSQVVPMEKINFHFTGDFHAITCANNMLAAALDNYLYQRPDILEKINKILFKRCIDINDRSLRNISYKIRKSSDFVVETGFNITPASELMAIFCLATSIEDLRRRINKIILAEYKDGTYLYAKDINITGSLIALLSEAFKPNIVQSLENNPVIIHGGPFANIAHGCNSIVATKLGMTLSDYVVTEAGFGADLGAEKFWDIKCQVAGITEQLKCVVLVCTIPGLKQFTGNIEDGFKNLWQHYYSLYSNGLNVIVTCNAFESDTEEDINALYKFCEDKDIICIRNTCFKDGGNGALELAKTVVDTCNVDHMWAKSPNYPISYSLTKKIGKLLYNVYGYNVDVELIISDKIIDKYNKIENDPEFDGYRVCIAKTQYSMNDDPEWVPVTGDKSTFTITDIEVNNGAEMIIVSAGNMMRMPGLPKIPAAERIDFINNKITGLS